MPRRTLRALAAALLTTGLAAAAPVPATATSDAPEPGTTAGNSLVQQVAAIQQTAQRALGDSFAGAWWEPADGRLTVATTDPGTVGQIRALGATPRLVQRDADALDALRAALDARADSVPDSVTGWYVDPASNSVVVRATDVTAGRRFAVGLEGVRVERVGRQPQPLADLVGGDALVGPDGRRCSIGFNATSGGARYAVTAGHCTQIGGLWTGFNGAQIGPVEDSSYPGNDYGAVRVTASSWNQGPWVSDGSGGRITVSGSTEAPIGATVCRSGSATGYRCGTIEAKDQTVNYGNGDVVSGLTRTSACAERGDSGGPFVAGSQAQGVLSGGSGNCLLGGQTFFQPINEILSGLGLDLVTG